MTTFDTWIPVKKSIITHRKTYKLKRLAGFKTRREAIGCVVMLLMFTLENAWRDGDLSHWDPLDIEHNLEWTGEPGRLISALQNCGKDNDEGETDAGFLTGMRVNDWEQHVARLIDNRAGRTARHERSMTSQRRSRREPAPDKTAENTRRELAKRGIQS